MNTICAIFAHRIGVTTMYRVATNYPVAFDSPDHLHPFGTMRDNSTDLEFIAELECRIARRPIRILDLGCSGGKLVHDMLDRGHDAIGLEGSDYSLKHSRAEWPALAGTNLFTCDIARPFSIYRDDELAVFDVATAWEVLEHLPEDRLPVFFENLRKHLRGLFIGSITSYSDWGLSGAAELHLTQRPAEWWLERFAEAGLETDTPMEHHVRLGNTMNFVLKPQ
jgi:SAM-dependent methyltransferase